MNFFKNKKNLIITGICALAVIIISVLSVIIWNGAQVPAPEVKFYGFSEEINLDNYLPLAQAKQMVNSLGGVAVQVDCAKIFKNGEVVSVSQNAAKKDETEILVDASALGIGDGFIKVSEAENKLGKIANVHESKLIVFLDEEVNVFDNFYTFEMISLLLRDAPEEDIINALITLPYTITNDDNIIITYTDPDIDLGFQTEMYSAQIGSDNEINKPLIVAGEGESDKNHTIVRVYNEYSAKTS